MFIFHSVLHFHDPMKSVYPYSKDLFELMASHSKMLALMKMSKEFAKTTNVHKLSVTSEIDKARRTQIEEDILLGNKNVTLGMQQKTSYRLGASISSIEARNVLVVTRARSGSSFLGELLSQYPGTFYSYEPLITLKGDKNTTDQIELLRQVFHCEPGKDYVEYPRSWNLLLYYNLRFFHSCNNILKNNAACYMPEVYHSVCPMFPLRLIKTIRLPFEEANTLLIDPEIGKTLKIVFLFRDPRGVFQSLKSKVHWCKAAGSCEISNFCNGVQNDVKAALDLKKQFPGKIT